MKNKSIRDSKFELLRIITMFFIVLNHSVSHGIFESYSFTCQDVNWQLCVCYFLSHFGDVGNGIFMLLTGYFSYQKRKREINTNAISDIIVKMSFYSIAVYVVLLIFGLYTFTYIDTIMSVFPFAFGFNWYLCCHIIVVIFSPLLLIITDVIEEKKLYGFLFVMFIMKFVMPLFKITTYMPYAHDFYQFSFMYIIGALINKYLSTHDKLLNTRIALIMTTICLALILIFSFGVPFVSKAVGNDTILSFSTYMRSFLVSAVPVCVFSLVINLKSYHSRAINYIAVSVPTIYLLHDNRYLRTFIWSKNYGMMQSDLFFVYIFLVCAAVFILCVFVDIIIRNLLCGPKKKIACYVSIIIIRIVAVFKKLMMKASRIALNKEI